MKKELATIWNGARLPVAVVIGIFLLNLTVLTPKRLYEEQKAIADMVPKLKAEIQDRTNNLDVEGPAFGNVIGTINVFRSYRADVGRDAECEIRITSPENSNIARQIASLAKAGAGCRVFGPADTGGDPKMRDAAYEGIKTGTIRLRAAKEASGAEKLFLDFRNYVQMERDYKTFPGSPPYVIWLQFGTGVKWNTQLR